jgi:hypothetical protein
MTDYNSRLIRLCSHPNYGKKLNHININHVVEELKKRIRANSTKEEEDRELSFI